MSHQRQKIIGFATNGLAEMGINLQLLYSKATLTATLTPPPETTTLISTRFKHGSKVPHSPAAEAAAREGGSVATNMEAPGAHLFDEYR